MTAVGVIDPGCLRWGGPAAQNHGASRMVRVTISDELKQQLLGAEGSVELVDSSGRFVANAVRESSLTDSVMQAAWPDYREDELKELADYKGLAITTAELLARLKAKS